jgi:hypothetical protein
MTDEPRTPRAAVDAIRVQAPSERNRKLAAFFGKEPTTVKGAVLLTGPLHDSTNLHASAFACQQRATPAGACRFARDSESGPLCASDFRYRS